jgi:hypothetical protein
MWYIVYNFVLIKNDTFVSVIICYDFHHNDFDVFFFFDENVRAWFMLTFYSETSPLQRGQTSSVYQCLRLIIINKQLHVC